MIGLRRKKHTTWKTVLIELANRPGVTMFLGASDTGKTTCLRAAAVHLTRAGLLPLAIVDADIGQSTIGPPTTVGLTLVTKQNIRAVLSGRFACHAMRFIGALSPVGHLLPTIVATKKLVDKAVWRGTRAVLVDTTGLIGGRVGFQLKINKIELLAPRHLVALQHEGELEEVLSVLADRRGLSVHRLAVSCQLRARSAAERYRYRTSRFACYFSSATRCRLEMKNLSILSTPAGSPKLARESLSQIVSLESFPAQSLAGCLVGLNNASNETLGLGLLDAVSGQNQKVTIFTPLRQLSRVRILQLSNIRLARTGEELGRAESQIDNASN